MGAGGNGTSTPTTDVSISSLKPSPTPHTSLYCFEASVEDLRTSFCWVSRMGGTTVTETRLWGLTVGRGGPQHYRCHRSGRTDPRRGLPFRLRLGQVFRRYPKVEFISFPDTLRERPLNTVSTSPPPPPVPWYSTTPTKKRGTRVTRKTTSEEGLRSGTTSDVWGAQKDSGPERGLGRPGVLNQTIRFEGSGRVLPSDTSK